MDTSKEDWNIFLKEINYSAEDDDYYLNHMLDTAEFDEVAGKVICIKNNTYTKRKSDSHGYGIFAEKYIKKGDDIGIAIGYNNNEKYRSYIGRFSNHSNNKNAIFIQLDSKDVVAMCVKDIDIGEEILFDYRDHWGKW